MDATPTTIVPLDQRPLKDTICLFDVDNTLTPARLVRPDALPSLLLPRHLPDVSLSPPKLIVFSPR